MRVHYRRLTRHFDPKAYQDTLWAQAHNESGFAGTQALGSSRRVNHLEAYIEAPRAVEVEAHEAELDEVRRLVRDGWLEPTDLVNLGTGWQTIEQTPEFDSDCEEVAQHRRGELLRLIALALVGLAVVAVAWWSLVP